MSLETGIVLFVVIVGFAVLFYTQRKMLAQQKGEELEQLVNKVFGLSVQRVAEQSKSILMGEKEVISADLQHTKASIEKLVLQLHEDMKVRQEEIRLLEQDRVHKFAAISTALEQQKALTQDLKISTEQLSKVLSNNQERGAWGERIIEDLLLSHGLVEGTHYSRQRKLDNSTLKPDITLLLPDHKVVPVDVKFPYSEMQKLAEAETKSAQLEHLKQFEVDLKTKITKVAEYINPAFNTLDYAILFVPNEMVFSFINQKFPHIVEFSLRKRVLLVSPLTFLIVARTVAESYRNFMVGDKLREVIKHVDEFSMEWEKFYESFSKYGKQLKTLQDGYDELMGTRKRQMERKILQVKSKTVSEHLLEDVSEHT